jgi:3-oxoacyl-[acyl-carrier protein] reductase
VETKNENLTGRVALVTGAGRGIGRAIAVGLAATGARVAVLARSADEVQQTVDEIGRNNQAALGVPGTVTDPEHVSSALSTIGDQWGPVDILVNNAAVVWPLAPSAALDPQEWAAALEVNVTAPARLSFNVLTGMLERQWGRIVNVSSGIAANPTGMPRGNAYVTTKVALEAHTVNLAAELKGSGVTVNVFRPGIVDTEMQGFIRSQDPDRIGGGLHQHFVSIHQQGMLLTPEQSAASLLTRLHGDGTGQIWDADDDLATTKGNQR